MEQEEEEPALVAHLLSFWQAGEAGLMSGENLLQTPSMIGESSSHRRRLFQLMMAPTEIVRTSKKSKQTGDRWGHKNRQCVNKKET